MRPDDRTGSRRAFQIMVAMRDGTRLNTFVFLPASGGLRWPVILHRTPYGITAADAPDKTDIAKGWLPSPEEPLRGSILRGWRNCSLVPKTRERQLQFRDDNRRGNAAHHSSMGGNCEARG